MQKTARDTFAHSLFIELEKSGSRPEQDQRSVQLYQNDVPPFAATAMDRLYGSLYSSAAYLSVSGKADQVHTYVARREGAVSAVFVFLIEGSTLRVVNEGMRLPSEEIRRFAQCVFEAHAGIDAINFHAIQSDGQPLGHVHQRFFCAENFIVSLPASPDAYLAGLGSATRKNIKRHRNRIERDFPSFSHRLYEGHEVDEEDVRGIISLNRARMASKNKESFIDEEVAREILALVRKCGEVCVARIDGRLCAGTIIFRVGDSHVSFVHAHDPQYDPYRLGMVCCFLAICACLERGGTHFHLGQGRYEYKVALLGKYEKFDHLTLYRSRWSKFRHARMAAGIAAAGYRLQLNRWLLARAATGESPLWRGVGRALGAWRALKQRFGRA